MTSRPPARSCLSGPTRRRVMALPLALLLPAVGCRTRMPATDERRADAMFGDVEQYVDFGVHRAGSPGDQATADWMRGALDAAGFRTRFIETPTQYTEPLDVRASWAGGGALDLFPAWPVVTTPDGGLTSRAVQVEDPTRPVGDLTGRIAVVELPFPAYGTLNFGPTRDQLDRVLMGRPDGVILLTAGLTGEIIALNSSLSRPPFPCPVVYGAPNQAGALREAARAGAPVTLTVTARTDPQGVIRNVVGERPGAGPVIVVSTPISGWFRCGGERGPGIAFWREMARRLPDRLAGRRLIFIANSGHEIDGVGAREALHQAIPGPDRIAVWAHLGAGMATYEWRRTAGGLERQAAGPDPERYLVTGRGDFVPVLERAFAGQPGLDAPRAVKAEEAFGETRVFLAEGYRRLFGVFAGHDLHHTPIDTAQSTGPELLAPVAAGLETAILALATSGVSGPP